MKSKILKFVILASSLAFFNCGDSVNNALEQAQAAAEGQSVPTDPYALSSSGMTDPGFGGGEGDGQLFMSSSATDFMGGSQAGEGQIASSADFAGPASSDAVVPTSSEAFVPTSSDAVSPASSDAVIPPTRSSSSTVKPASSSAVAEPESSSSEEVKPESGIFLAEGTEEEKNYMEVEYIRNTADNGGGVLCYPKQLSSTKKHAVVLWGPGGGSSPNDYEGIIRRLASHGFVVVATSESPEGTGRGKPALDWLAKKNSTQGDVLYDKLDMTKVGASGHSMGGLQSEQMAIADDRVITAFLNNSGGFNHNEMTRISPTKTVAVVYGEGGMERPNAEGDYNNNNVKAPACLIKMTGGQGNECQNGECGYGHGSGPWDGMAATVAWMRWHLGGEDWRKADFVGTTGKYIDGPIIGKRGKWKGQCKNF